MQNMGAKWLLLPHRILTKFQLAYFAPVSGRSVRTVTRGRRTALLLLMWLVVGTISARGLAEEQSAIRQIAPDRFPAYGSPINAEPVVRVVPATAKLPYGACEDTLPRIARLTCLRETSILMDDLVAENAKEALKALGERRRVRNAQHSLERAFSQAQELWRTLRDLECGELIILQSELSGDTYERKLRCLIRADLDRIAAMKLMTAAN